MSSPRPGLLGFALLPGCTLLFPFSEPGGEGESCEPLVNLPCISALACDDLPEIEPNDRPCEANTLVCSESPLEEGDEDWFVVNHCETGYLNVEVHVDDLGDGVVMAVYREEAALTEPPLRGTDCPSALECVRLEEAAGVIFVDGEMQEGVYFVRVSADNKRQDTSYRLYVGE
jgi:hypothetical protein